MNAVTYAISRKHPASAFARRNDLSISLMQISLGISAENYMMLGTGCGPDASEARIFASNWVYDAIGMVGLAYLAGLAQGGTSVPLGGSPEPIVIDNSSNGNKGLHGGPESELARFGHREIYALRLSAGVRRGVVLFSASATGRIRRAQVSAAQFRCAYLLSEIRDQEIEATPRDPLSERERECLFWVAEGKTTDEVALIVGVSTNTANRYIAQAIQKLAASNRAKAVATAIRRGLL